MAVYNSPKLLLDGIKTQWLQMLAEKPKSAMDGVIFKTESDTEFERYPILGGAGGLKEWVDKVNYDKINDYIQLVQNKAYMAGYAVDRFTLSDSKKTLGAGLESFIQAQLSAWETMPDKMIAKLLEDNPTAFDGTAFFSATRPNLSSSGAINNIVTGTGTTRAQLSADLGSAMDLMRTFRNANGDPYNPTLKFAVMIPSQFERDFRAIQTSEYLAGIVAQSNEFKGMFDIIVNPYLSTAAGLKDDWYLINSATPYKFAVAQTDINNPPMWDMEDIPSQREIKYFTTGRMGFGLLNPLAIVKINNT